MVENLEIYKVKPKLNLKNKVSKTYL